MFESGKNSVQRLEYWNGNTYYGIGEILKNYARLPSIIPLNFRIQHGVTLFSIYASLDNCKQIVNFYVPERQDTVFLMFNNDYLHYFHDKGIYNVEAIGAPIIYLGEYIEKTRKQIPSKSGTIVFPHNSTHNIDVSTNFDLYARQLLELPKEYHPIKICMYFLDIEKGHDEPFRSRGFEVLCNGNLWTQSFFYNFIRNTLPFEYATSNNNLSSTAYYSIFLGLKYFLYGPSVGYELSGHAKQYSNEYPVLKRHDEIFGFSIEDCENQEYQKKIAFRELGVNSKLSRKEMRAMILRGLNKRFLKDYLRSVAPRFRNGGRALKLYGKIRALTG